MMKHYRNSRNATKPSFPTKPICIMQWWQEKQEQVAVPREGPSKKELNKLARKEGKKKGKDAEEEAVHSLATIPSGSSPNVMLHDQPAGGSIITFHPAHPPILTRHTIALLSSKSSAPSLISSASSVPPHVATLGSVDGTSTLSGDAFIAKFIARQNGLLLCGAENDYW
jgi:hypothetical protein